MRRTVIGRILSGRDAPPAGGRPFAAGSDAKGTQPDVTMTAQLLVPPLVEEGQRFTSRPSDVSLLQAVVVR